MTLMELRKAESDQAKALAVLTVTAAFGLLFIKAAVLMWLTAILAGYVSVFDGLSYWASFGVIFLYGLLNVKVGAQAT